jgi:hypothetical protein
MVIISNYGNDVTVLFINPFLSLKKNTPYKRIAWKSIQTETEYNMGARDRETERYFCVKANAEYVMKIK